MMSKWHVAIAAGWLTGISCAALAAPLASDAPGAKQEAERLDKLPPVAASTGHADMSGRKEKGRASFYSRHFTNRKMANGRRMNPNTNTAASKTLPLGSVAKVTNLENGKTATVRIEDRGPYVNGRVVDLAPKVADDLDTKQKGVSLVEVKPITLPQPDGSVKLGAGAADASPQELHQAVETTKALAGSKGAETADK